jgi:hypothetical protein
MQFRFEKTISPYWINDIRPVHTESLGDTW